MSYYIHFWTKDGKLERVPYSTMEEAEKAAWAWERAEGARINPEQKIGGLSGVMRDKMISIITDEDNNPCPIDFWGRAFFWDIKHNRYFSNENHWCVQFEAASRGLTTENIVCSPDCYNCQNNVDMDGNFQKTVTPIKKERSREEEILLLFSNGMARKDIAALADLPYQTVCKIIRNAKVA